MFKPNAYYELSSRFAPASVPVSPARAHYSCWYGVCASKMHIIFAGSRIQPNIFHPLLIWDKHSFKNVRSLKFFISQMVLLTRWNELWNYRVRIKDSLFVWWSHRSSILTMQRTGRLRGEAGDETGTPLQGFVRFTAHAVRPTVPHSVVSATVGRSMRGARASSPNSFYIPYFIY